MTAIDLVNRIRRLTPQGKYVLTNVQAVALIKQMVEGSEKCANAHQTSERRIVGSQDANGLKMKIQP